MRVAPNKPSKRTPETPRLLRLASPCYVQEAMHSAAVYGDDKEQEADPSE